MPSSLTYVLGLFTGLFLFLEVRPLIRQREYKVLIVASLVLIIGLFYGMDYAMNWEVLPNPKTLLTILKPVSESVDKFFQVS